MSDSNDDKTDAFLVSRRRMVWGSVTSAAAGSFLPNSVSAQTEDGYSVQGQNFQAAGGRIRPLADKLAERVSLLDFDVDPTGRNDSSAGFSRAIGQIEAGQLFVPTGIYLVQDLAVLGGAGIQIIGESRFRTVFRTEAGARPLFSSQVAATSTSAFQLLSDFMIDLNGQGGIGIDLASINASSVHRIHFTGGPAGTTRGIGLRFAAPLDRGAYDNAIYDCSFEYLDRGVVWDRGANNNAAYNCRVTNCRIGFDAAPAGGVDTPRIFGGRVEGCEIGLYEGAICGAYLALRFEDNSAADIAFVKGSENAAFWGALTATSRTVVRDLDLATSPHIDSSELGDFQIEESDQRPRISSGRHIFGKSGKAPSVHPERDYAAYFHDYILLGGRASIDFAGPAGNGRIEGMLVDNRKNLVVAGYDRKAGEYISIKLGGGPAIMPVNDNATDLGTISSRYKALHLSAGVHIRGDQVLAARQPAITDDRSGSANAETINTILRTLRRHGLIES